MKIGDLVYKQFTSLSYEAIIKNEIFLPRKSIGIIIGKINSNLNAWKDNPHALSVAKNGFNLYYVYYSDGNLDGPVTSDKLKIINETN